MVKSSVIDWIYYPKSENAPPLLRKVVECFAYHQNAIDSHTHNLSSNEVLRVLADSMSDLGFIVESKSSSIKVPVLFGRSGQVAKSFSADAQELRERVVVEIEAGRAVDNYQFLKDLFEACMMNDIEYLVIAVRKTYRGRNDFDYVLDFFETLYSSRRLTLPLRGILIIGY